MKAAGFNKAEIEHCVTNSDFVLKNGKLTDHPKHASYRNHVQPAIMMVRDKSTGVVTQEPAMVETWSNSYKVWNIFERSFAKGCTFTNPSPNAIDMTCKRHGKLKGRFKSKGNGRVALVMENSKYQVLYMTNRTQSFVRSWFNRYF